MEIAMQMYSLRESTKTPSGLRDTLKKLRECGYRYVETAGYFDMTAENLAHLLAQYGLKAISAHIGIEDIVTNINKVIEDSLALGVKNCCVPSTGRYYQRSAAGYSAAGEILNSAAEKLLENGISLSYHNHQHEFNPINGSCGFELIYEHAPLVKVQLDVGHAYAAGQVPEEWILRYIDRIVTIHYKDVRFIDGVRRDYPIGEGEVNWKAVTTAVKKSGCEYIIIEHEEFIRDNWDICKTSYNNIAKFLKDK